MADNNQLTSEDKVIIVTIVITLILSPLLTVLWFIDNPILIPPPIISIFLGIAVSALLYRFLGGVHDASFTIGALKVTGTAAILIFVSWWSNEELKEFIPKINDESKVFKISKDITPKPKTWYAVNKNDGLPIELEFPVFKEKHSPPLINELNNLRKNRNINLVENNNTIYAVIKNGSSYILGQVPINEVNNLGFSKFHGIDIQLKPYRVVEFSSSQRIDINTNLPFTIETRGFSENYTRFALISKNANVKTIEDSILLRGAKVYFYKEKYYLISVIQVNHETEKREPYAKIYVAEIQAKSV